MDLWTSLPGASEIIGLAIILYVGYVIAQIIITAFEPGLHRVPGPVLSRFTVIPLKIAILSGRRSIYIHTLHEKYGLYVRIAPTEVSIADIASFRTIHRIGSNFNKGPWYQGQTPTQINDETCGVFGILNNKSASPRRRLFQAAGARKTVTEWEPQVIELVDLAIEKMKGELKDRRETDVMKWWTFLASDVTGALAFGEPFGNVKRGLKNELMEDIDAAMPMVGMRAELPWTKPILDHVPLWCGNTWTPRFHRFNSYALDAVRATRAAQASGGKTLFSKMVLEEEKNQSVPDSVIINEATNVIVAGTDTTSMTLTYLVFEVLKHPDVLTKLKAAVKDLTVRPSWKELEGCTYLNNVIQESMRLHPAVPGSLMRLVPSGGATIGPYRLPEGVQVDTQAWTFQRDSNVFEDAYLFKPDRWNSSTPLMKEHMMQFGAAARICLGENIARLEILHAVSRFFRELDVTLAPSTTDESMEMIDYFAIRPKAAKCVVVPQ